MEQAMHAFGGFAMVFGGLQDQPHVNTADDQHVFLRLHLAGGFADQKAIAGRNFARLQRAPVGSDESTGGGGDDIVERGCMRLELFGRDFVMLGDCAMGAKVDRVILSRQVGDPQGSAEAFYFDAGGVGDL